jgi:hypothetical protein
MANILEAFGTITSLTITNLNSLASSVTAGWMSAAIDNTSNLYLDYGVQIKFAAVNTAPSSQKAFFLYAAPVLDDTTSDYATTGAASEGGPTGIEGTLTFPDITANPVNIPLIGVVPYVGQNAVIISPVFSIAAAFNDMIPPKFVLGLVNASGMTIAASGNYVKIRGIYRTVA